MLISGCWTDKNAVGSRMASRTRERDSQISAAYQKRMPFTRVCAALYQDFENASSLRSNRSL